MASNSYSFDVWNCCYRGQPDQTGLDASKYKFLIWAIPYSGYLTSYSKVRQSLNSYLNEGGKLFISGNDLAFFFDYCNYDKQLLHDFFHAEFVNDNTGYTKLKGVAGDPITNGLSLKLTSGYNTDEINPLSPALTILTYDSTSPPSIPRIDSSVVATEISYSDVSQPKETAQVTGITASGSRGIRVDAGTYQLVFLSFSFHDINSPESQALLMKKILEWLGLAAGPKISQVQVAPSYVSPGETVIISARVEDEAGVASVSADIESPDETVRASLTLFDDGLHQDQAANDGLYANSWTTLPDKLDYLVDITAFDNTNNTGRLNNAASFTTRDVPYIQLDHLSFYSNSDNLVSPGEYVNIKAYLKNVGAIAAINVAATIFSTDPYVSYYSSGSKNFGNIQPGQIVATANNSDYYFRLADTCPDSQVIAFQMQIVDDQSRSWSHPFDFLVTDNVGPRITFVELSRRYVPVGQSIHLSVDAIDGSGIAKIITYFKDGATNAMIDSLVLYDDGNHGDGSSGDNRFGNSWITPASQPASGIIKPALKHWIS